MVSYEERLARLQACFFSAVNSGLPAVYAALKALQEAYPAAKFELQDGLLKRERLAWGLAERSQLDDILQALALELAAQAVASAAPLLQWQHPQSAAPTAAEPGAPAVAPLPPLTHAALQCVLAPASNSSVERFLDLACAFGQLGLVEAVSPEVRTAPRRIISSDCWMRVLEAMMDVCTIEDCSQLFGYMESRLDVFLDSTLFNDTKLTLLRTCNVLARRLSKAFDVQLCGRLLIFLSRTFPLNDRAGVNLLGAVNVMPTPVDDVQPGDLDSLGEAINKKLYLSCWGLQQVFQNPAQILTPAVYAKVVTDITCVLDEFAKLPAVAAVGLLARGHDGSDTDEEMSSAADLHEQISVRYLTSSKLFGLQLRDCTFRRHFLVQCLTLLHFHDQPRLPATAPGDKAAERTVVKPESLEPLRERLYTALGDTKNHGPDFASIIRTVIAHEWHWVAWKTKKGATPNETCADFCKPSAAPLPEPGTKRRRTRGSHRPQSDAARQRMAYMAQPCPDIMESLAAVQRIGPPEPPSMPGEPLKPPRPMLPTLQVLLERAEEGLDPDNDIELEYRITRCDPVYMWKAQRMIARHHLELYSKTFTPTQDRTYNALELGLLELRPHLKDKIKAARAAALASEAAAKAAAEAPASVPAATSDTKDDSAAAADAAAAAAAAAAQPSPMKEEAEDGEAADDVEGADDPAAGGGQEDGAAEGGVEEEGVVEEAGVSPPEAGNGRASVDAGGEGDTDMG